MLASTHSLTFVVTHIHSSWSSFRCLAKTLVNEWKFFLWQVWDIVFLLFRTISYSFVYCVHYQDLCNVSNAKKCCLYLKSHRHIITETNPVMILFFSLNVFSLNRVHFVKYKVPLILAPFSSSFSSFLVLDKRLECDYRTIWLRLFWCQKDKGNCHILLVSWVLP